MHKKLFRMTMPDYINYAFMFLLCALFLYPIVLTISISVSDLAETRIVTLLPQGFSLDSYKFILGDSRVMRYFANSVFYSVTSTTLSLLLTSLTAYPFVIPQFRGKKYFNLFMIITMFISGGLIPYYYVIRVLKLIDNVLVMIIPGVLGAYNVVIFRTFFSQQPAELRESAYIDGAGNYRILFQIILPMSKALLATFGLFGLVGKWNDWFTSMLFLRNQDFQPIQMMLRRMLVQLDFRDTQNLDRQMMYQAVTSRSVKCAAVVVTMVPVICVYPFLQKYFTKGIMVGALKA